MTGKGRGASLGRSSTHGTVAPGSRLENQFMALVVPAIAHFAQKQDIRGGIDLFGHGEQFGELVTHAGGPVVPDHAVPIRQSPRRMFDQLLVQSIR